MHYGFVQSQNGQELMDLVNGSRNRGVAVSEKPFSSFATYSSLMQRGSVNMIRENRSIREYDACKASDNILKGFLSHL